MRTNNDPWTPFTQPYFFQQFSHVQFEKRYCCILSLRKQLTALETLQFDIIFSLPTVVFVTSSHTAEPYFFLKNFSQVKLEERYSMNFFVVKRLFVSLKRFESISYSLPIFLLCVVHSIQMQRFECLPFVLKPTTCFWKMFLVKREKHLSWGGGRASGWDTALYVSGTSISQQLFPRANITSHPTYNKISISVWATVFVRQYQGPH